MKNINLVKGMLTLLLVQLVSTSMLYAIETNSGASNITRGLPIDDVEITLRFSEQTTTSIKVSWDPVVTVTNYKFIVDGGPAVDLGNVTEYVVFRSAPGPFTVQVEAWKMGGTDELVGASEVVNATTFVKAPGYALSWDEINPISTNLQSPSQVISANSDFTIEFWVKAEAIEDGIFNISSAGGFSMNIEKNGDLFIYDGLDLMNPVASATGIIDLKDPSNPPTTPSGSNPPPLPPHIRSSNQSSWQHIAIVYENTVGYTIYKDGKEFEALHPTTTANLAWTDFRINNIKGQFDELRVWSTVRSATQVKAYAFSTVDTAHSAGLELYYRFDQSPGANTVIDLTGNGYTSDINSGTVTEPIVRSYAMVRPIGLGAYASTAGDQVVVYWKDSNVQPIIPRVDPTKSIYDIYVSEVEGDYTTLVGGGPFLVQATLTGGVLSHTFDTSELDATKAYYIKISMEDDLDENGDGVSDFNAVQSAYSLEIKYDPAIASPVPNYDGPVNAVAFDNAQTYAYVSNSFASSLGSEDFTVEAWFKPTTTSGVLLASKDSLSAVGWDITLSGGVPVLNLSDGITQVSVPAGNEEVSLNRWHHIAFVRKSGVVTPYLDTVTQATVDANLDISWTGGLSFGNYNVFDASKAFIGELDEVRIYDGSRTATDIRNFSVRPASLDVTVPTFSLVAYYKCNRESLSVLKDEFGADASLYGETLLTKTQSEAMGCPMIGLATDHGSSKFVANWTKPSVINPDAVYYTVETSNGPTIMDSGTLFYSATQEDDFDVETAEVANLEFAHSAYFYRVSTVYNFGDINGDGDVNEDDYVKRFSKTTALQLELSEPTPGKCYTRSGTSTLTTVGSAPLHDAKGTSLTTSVWFNLGVNPASSDLNNILRIYNSVTSQTRLRIHLKDGRIKVQTDGGEADNGALGLLAQHWYALTVVWASNGASVYLDGTLLFTTVDAGLLPDGSDGSLVLESDFTGKLDDLKIWKRELTDQEVKDQMNFELDSPISESDLVAYYDFNVSRGPFIADLSQNGHELEVKDDGRFGISYALGCPNALPFEGVDYNKFSVAWNETVDWGLGALDPTVQNYDYTLNFKSETPSGRKGRTTITGVTATADGVDKLSYLVTSLDTSESEAIELNPENRYYCVVSRSMTNPFTGQIEQRNSMEISSKLRSDAPGECLNLLGNDDSLTLPDTMPQLGPNFTIEAWAKFGKPTSERYTFVISTTGVASRTTSAAERSFIFSGTDEGSPFLAIDWLLDDPDYNSYVQGLFDRLIMRPAPDDAKVQMFDLNGNPDDTASYIKTTLPDGSDHLLKVDGGKVTDDQFEYVEPIVLAGKILLGFKNSADEAQTITNGFLRDYDDHLGLDDNGADGGEVLGVPSIRARWYNFALTYDSTTLKLFVDGVEVGLTSDPNGTYDPTKKLTTLGDKFDGFIEEFRVWDEVHSADVLKNQRYTELDIEGVDLVDPAEKAEAEAKRIERSGLSDADFAHLVCYLPFSTSQREGVDKILNVATSGGEAKIVNGETNWLILTLENRVCWPYSVVDGVTLSYCNYFPCLKMGYSPRSFDGSTTTPDEDTTPTLIKSAMTLTDTNTMYPGEFYSYTTFINPHTVTTIDGRAIPTRYLSGMWGLADPSLKSKQVTQQSWFIDTTGLMPTEDIRVPDPDGNLVDYTVPLTYDITIDMKTISPEVYDVNYSGPDTTGMSEAQKQGVRDKFDGLSDEDFQLLWRGNGSPVKKSTDVYTDLTALYPAPDPDSEDPQSPSIPIITARKIGSTGTRAGTAFTVTFTGVPRRLVTGERDDTAMTSDIVFSTRGYFALGMSVSLNDMVLTPVTGLVSDVKIANGVATVSWSVVTETGVKKYLLEKLGADGKWFTIASVDSDASLTYALQDLNHMAGDEYRITTIDINGIMQSFATGSASATTMYITLDKGWNLISIPLDDADLTALNNSTTGYYWIWNGENYERLQGAPEALEGVWVYSYVNNTPVQITGHESNQTELELATGWNLKGPRENMYFDDQAMTVYTWTNMKQYIQISDAINQIVAGQGYWIFNPDEDKRIPLRYTPVD